MTVRALAAKLFAPTAAVAVLTWATAASANPIDAFGFGSRESALANAGAANASGVPANYYNPASIGAAKRFEAMLGYSAAFHSLSVNGKSSEVDSVRGINGGLVVPGKFFSLPVAFGLSVHLPDERLSRVRAQRQEEPRWELYDNRNQRLVLSANLAFQPFEWLELGGGMSFMASTRGHLEISGAADIVKPENSPLRHSVDADLTAVRYPQFGARIKFGKNTAFGLVHRGEFRLRLDLTGKVDGDITGLTTALYELETHSINNFQPGQWVFALSQVLTKGPMRVVGMFDVEWVRWSTYEPPVAQLQAKLDIPPPKGGWPSGITPPSAPTPQPVIPLDIHDRIVPRFGLEGAMGSRALAGLWRLGYAYESSPIAPQTGATNYIDRDRHVLGIGLGLQIGRDVVGPSLQYVRWDIHSQFSLLARGLTRKDNPADFIGDYNAGGSIVNIGTTVTVGFGK